METYDIITYAVCILFVLVVFRMTRLEKRLRDERRNARFWKEESEVQKESVEYYKRELDATTKRYAQLRERHQQIKLKLLDYVTKEGKEGEALPS